MKINNVPGEFGFRALVRVSGESYFDKDAPSKEYSLSKYYFLDIADAQANCGNDCKWPVEVLDNGSVYIPDTSELE